MNARSLLPAGLFIVQVLLWSSSAVVIAQPADRLDYSRDILPILSDNCYHCHGPDADARQADLRLDTEEGGLGTDGGPSVIVRGQSDASELIRRIFSDDEYEVMPPADSNRRLTAEQKNRLRQWIDEGASWGEHWSFRPMRRAPLPIDTLHAQHPWRSVIDLFVERARLEQGLVRPVHVEEHDPRSGPTSSHLLATPTERAVRGISAPEAPRARLIRRVTLDLTGLPPALEEIEAFLDDDSPDAYERLVDRLLASPRFGERLASDWLDIARFADTHGYQMDRYRAVWPYREWIIRAFNENLSYDKFVTWQLAGDLLPEATKEQRLATAFQRLHMQNEEGGIVEEEFRVSYVVDRVNTFGTAFLGMTFECTRCHDHKYDPLTQRDFYSLFAFFQNIDESGQTSYFTASMPVPTLLLSSDEQDRELRRLETEIQNKEAELHSLRATSERAFVAWRQELQKQQPVTMASPDAWYPLDHLSEAKTRNLIDEDQPGRAHDGPELIELEGATTEVATPDSRIAIRLSGENGFTFPGVGHFSRVDPFSLSLFLRTPDHAPRYVILHHSRAPIDAGSRGYEVLLEEGKVAFGLHHMWPGNSLKVRTRQIVSADAWDHVTISYDGSSRAHGIRIYLDGEPMELDVIRDGLSKDITYDGGEPDLALGYRFRDNGFRGGQVRDLRVFSDAVTPLEARWLASNDRIDPEKSGARSSLTSVSVPPPNAPEDWFSPARERDLRDHFWQREFPDAGPIREELAELRRQHNALLQPIPEIMVMEELPELKPAFILRRGEYDQHGEEVTADTPAVLPDFPADAPRDRLGLAQWLLDNEHPLMARVTVNRYWQMLFGRGLVDTPDNFGFQGSAPSHPELLDWLALEFIDRGWDQKALLREIVLSATYRQSSSLGRADLASEEGSHPREGQPPEDVRISSGSEPSDASIPQPVDPNNRWLTRAPARRLTAEMLRDQALVVSGQLVEKLGGPSVKPYQPEGLWDIAMGKPSYDMEKGGDRYRRSLYTFWKRTVPPPAMVTFDAAERNNCTVERQSTSTPLQALVLLNDPQWTEASRELGRAMLRRGGETDDERVEWLFRSVMTRSPSAAERTVLRQLFEDQTAWFLSDLEGARQLLELPESADRVAKDRATKDSVTKESGTQESDTQENDIHEITRQAAATVLALALLNHDEAVMRR